MAKFFPPSHYFFFTWNNFQIILGYEKMGVVILRKTPSIFLKFLFSLKLQSRLNYFLHLSKQFILFYKMWRQDIKKTTAPRNVNGCFLLSVPPPSPPIKHTASQWSSLSHYYPLCEVGNNIEYHIELLPFSRLIIARATRFPRTK